MSRAIKNRYLELYRKSRKQNDNTVAVEEEELQEKPETNHSFENLVTVDDMEMLESKLEGKKKEIFELIFFKEYSDIEVAKELGISRQYVHRMRKLLGEEIKKEILDIW